MMHYMKNLSGCMNSENTKINDDGISQESH